MKKQKDLIKAWAKMELNSSYGFPPIPNIPMEYDENKARIFSVLIDDCTFFCAETK